MKNLFERRRTHFLALLLMVCAGTLGCKATVRQIAGGVDRDYQEYMRPLAGVLKEISPEPVWSTTVDSPDISEIVQLGKGTLLVGFRGLKVQEGYYQIQKSVNGPYVAFDVESGRQLWQFDTKEDEHTEYSAIPAEGIVLVRENNKEATVYHALDRETGALRWKLDVGLLHAFNVAPAAGVIVFAEPKAGGDLFAVDLKTGREKWRVKGACEGEEGFPDIKFRNKELLLVAGQKVGLYDLSNGHLKWRTKRLGTLGSRSFPVWLESGAIVPLSGGKVVKLKPDGGVAWSADIGGEPGVLTIAKDLLLVQSLTPGQEEKLDLLCLSLDSGAVVWERSVPSSNKLHSDLSVANNLLAFTLSETLEIWNLKTGQTVNSIPLPKKERHSLWFSRDLDGVRIYPDSVVVGNEAWVASFSPKSGGQNWLYQVNGSIKYALSSALKERESAVNSWLITVDAPKEKRSLTLTTLSSQSQLNLQSPTSQAQRNLDAVMSGTGRVLQDRKSTSLERLSAHEQRINAISGNIAVIKTDIAMSKMVAAMNMQMNAWTNILGVVEVVHKVKMRGEFLSDRFRMLRAFARVPIAERARNLTMQQDWYVRPFIWKDGQGVLLVDMETGRWREIITSPDEGEIKDRYIDITLSLISTDGKRLMSFGIGLDAARWKTDERFLLRRTVLRSVLGYELGKVKFREVSQYPKFSVVR